MVDNTRDIGTVNLLIKRLNHESKFNYTNIDISLIKIKQHGSKHKVSIYEHWELDFIHDVNKRKRIFDFSWNIYHSFQRVPADNLYFFLFEVNSTMDPNLNQQSGMNHINTNSPSMWTIVPAVDAIKIASQKPIERHLTFYEYPFTLIESKRREVPRSHLVVTMYRPVTFKVHMTGLKVQDTLKKAMRALDELRLSQQLKAIPVVVAQNSMNLMGAARGRMDHHSHCYDYSENESEYDTDFCDGDDGDDDKDGKDTLSALKSVIIQKNQSLYAQSTYNLRSRSQFRATRASADSVYKWGSGDSDDEFEVNGKGNGTNQKSIIHHNLTVNQAFDEFGDSSTDDDDSDNDGESDESSDPDNLVGDYRMRFHLYKKGRDTIHVYIDRAECLPDNVTFTKIYAELFWVDFDGLQQSQYDVIKSKVCDRRSILNAPTFRLHCEYKQAEDEDKDFTEDHIESDDEDEGELIEFNDSSISSIANMNGTAVLLIKIDTLEKYEKRSQVVGYSAINLFVNPDTKRQPNLLNFTRCSVNVGAFRLPLFLEHPCKDNADAVCCVSQYIDDLPKLFGASVMIRISLNDEQPMLDMLDDHEYDEAMCGAIGEVERQLMTTKKTENEAKPVRVLHHFATHYSNIAKRRSSVHILDDQERFEMFVSPKMAVRLNQQELNLKFFAKYKPNLGLRIAIDGLHEVKPDGIYVVIFSVVPPNAFWRPFSVMENIHFTYHWDWDSTAGSPKFINHRLLRFSNFQYHPNAVLVTDVRKINFKMNKKNGRMKLCIKSIQHFGWSFFPLFADRQVLDRYGDNHHDVYTQNGIFQNIVFEGAVDSSILDEILEIGPRTYIQNQVAMTKKQRKTKRLRPSKASVFVSIYDEQRVWRSHQPFDRDKLDTSLIPKQLIQDYEYYTLDDKHNQNSNAFSLLPVLSFKFSLKAQRLWCRLPADVRMDDVDDLERQIADLIALELHSQIQPKVGMSG